MAIRIRKSIKLAPGLRLNLSGSGLSWTLGPKGMSLGMSRSGNYLNAGIPGSGLFTRTRLDGAQPAAPRPAATGGGTLVVTVSVDDDGVVSFRDDAGNPVSEDWVRAAKKKGADTIKALIQGKCDEINGQIESLGRVHEPVSRPGPHRFEAPAFNDLAPLAPEPQVPGFFDKWFKSRLQRIEDANRLALERHQDALADFEQRRRAFSREVDARRVWFDRLNAGDVAAIEQHLEAVLHDIAWPRETDVGFEVQEGLEGQEGVTVAIDLDLPEIEDMPRKTAAVPQRGLRLAVKDMSPTQIQKLYMRHTHALGARIAGEAFAASPAVQRVIVSAYSQRSNKATGAIADEYLYSARITRGDWLKIDFERIEHVDPVELLAMFDLRRDMSKTGVFKPIAPFEA